MRLDQLRAPSPDALRASPSRLNSGLPEFGINNVQVGQARPAWGRERKRYRTTSTLTE